MIVLPTRVDWSSPYGETWSFLTDVIESESGREQRRALRVKPRHEVAHQAFDTATRSAARRLSAATLSEIKLLPDAVRTTDAVSTASSGQPTLVVEARDWLGAAKWLIVDRGDAYEAVEVSSVSDGTVTLSNNLTEAVAAGTRVFLGLPGRLKPKMQTIHPTDALSRGDVEFEVEPGREVVVTGTAPQTFNGREVVLISPDWSSAPEIEYDDSVRFTDPGFGIRAPYRPRAWTRETLRHAHVFSTADAHNALVGAFLRARGRQRDLYVPTWFNDFPLLATVSSGSKFWRTEGHAFAQAYADNPAYRTIMVQTNAGVIHLLRVVEITTGGTAPKWSMIETVTGAPATLTPADIQRISWVPCVRFASDDLNVSWLTDTVARVQMNFITTEDL